MSPEVAGEGCCTRGSVAGGGGGGGRCCRARASPLTCLAVCFLVLTYNLLGAFLFLALEGASTDSTDTAVAASQPAPEWQPPGDLRMRTVERLWAITEDLNILYKENWTKLAARELLDFQRVLIKTLRGPERADLPPADYRWTFSTSFLYALTLITTIGHGNVTPKSTAGKLVAVAYSCVGIPIIMVYLSTIGGALARRARALYGRASRRPQHKTAALDEHRTPFQAALNLSALPVRSRAVPCGVHARVPLVLALLPAAAYVSLGAAVFHATERWTLVDGCFFSFSSLATIGFGELRPGRRAGAVSARAEDVAVGVCCLYILVGVVIVAMCFDLVQGELRALLRGVGRLCGASGSGAGAVHDKPPLAAS